MLQSVFAENICVLMLCAYRGTSWRNKLQFPFYRLRNPVCRCFAQCALGSCQAIKILLARGSGRCRCHHPRITIHLPLIRLAQGSRPGRMVGKVNRIAPATRRHRSQAIARGSYPRKTFHNRPRERRICTQSPVRNVQLCARPFSGNERRSLFLAYRSLRQRLLSRPGS